MKDTIENTLKVLFSLVLVAAAIWLICSYNEVVTQNCLPNPIYSDWNFFRLAFGASALH